MNPPAERPPLDLPALRWQVAEINARLIAEDARKAKQKEQEQV